MSITIQRRDEGSLKRDADFKASEYEIKYIVVFGLGEDVSREAALAAVHNASDRPSSVDSLPYAGVEFDSFEGDGRVACVNALYQSADGSVQSDASDELTSTVSFEASTSSKKCMTAIVQDAVDGSESDLDPGLSIGWNGKTGSDAEYTGVDILAGQMRETWIVSLPIKKLTTSYKRAIGSVAGKVNRNAFKGWDAGELLFLGATFSRKVTDKRVDITFNFAVQPNEDDVDLGPDSDGSTITASKYGWQYVWVIPGQKTGESSAGSYVRGAYVATVYHSADFGELGIPDETRNSSVIL